VVTMLSTSAVVKVPATFTVVPGANSTTFNIVSTPVNAVTYVTLTATYPSGRAVTAIVTVNPYKLTGLTVTPAELVGGSPASGTVTVAKAAPAGGITVALSSNSAFAVVPASVLVPAGTTSIGFSITTARVSAVTPVIVTATLAGLDAQAATTLDPVTVSSVFFTPASVLGGNPTTGNVTLTSVAPPGGVTVTLASNTGYATVPATVDVLPGASLAEFAVSTKLVPAQTSATITATVGASVKTGTLVLTAERLTGLSIAPTVTNWAQAATGTITISAPAPAGGVTVALASNNAAAPVPATIVVPVGTTTAPFKIISTYVGVNTNVVITATLNGLNAQAPLTLTPVGVGNR